MRQIRLVVLGLLMVLLPAPASAQLSFNFGTQCVLSPFVACIDLSMTSVFHAALNRSELRFSISNLQGTPGHGYAATGFDYMGITGITLENPINGAYGELNFPVVQAVGKASVAYDERGYTLMDVPRYQLDNTFVLWWDVDGFLYGCDVPENVTLTGMPRDENGNRLWTRERVDWTCGGSLNFSVFMREGTGRLSISNDTRATFEFYGGPLSHANPDEPWWSQRASCTTGVDCGAYVTPEPVSMVLLGSGLAGLAAVRRRRRKLSDN